MVEKKIMRKEIEKIKEMIHEGDTIIHIAKNLGLSRMSVYRAINKYSLRKQNIFTKLKNLFK